MESKEYCKWCEHCIITSLDKDEGTCWWDIGEHVKLSDDSCYGYSYDDNLERS